MDIVSVSQTPRASRKVSRGDQEHTAGKRAAGVVSKMAYNLCYHTLCSDDMSKLQYTHWCIKESLRLFPPVFNVFRELTQDVELGGFLVPKGIFCVDCSVLCYLLQFIV